MPSLIRPSVAASSWSTLRPKLDIIIPGPEIGTDPDATALWGETDKFIGAALARMERGKAFSIILGRIQHELSEAYGAENARRVMQAIMDTIQE